MNQIYFNPVYIFKLIENKIKKLFNFSGFFIYFKDEPKSAKFQKEENGRQEEKILENMQNKLNSSDSSENQISSIDEINRQNNLIFDRIIPEFLSSNEDELFDGKDYESRVRSYLKLFLECCTEKDLKIESNPGKSIKFIYKYYEKIITIDKIKINENIVGNLVKIQPMQNLIL